VLDEFVAVDSQASAVGEQVSSRSRTQSRAWNYPLPFVKVVP